jgi:mono/diheme cytochrome c family protein
VFLIACIAWAPPAAADLDQGQRVYATNCAVCHGPAGDGKGPAWLATIPRPQVFSDMNYMSRLTDQYLFEIVKYGKRAVIKQEVKGSTLNVMPMPSFGDELTDAEIRDLLMFQRTLRGSGTGSTRTRALFQENCVPCHGPDGRGNGRTASKLQPAPPTFVSAIQPAPGDITDPLFMNRFSDEFLFTVIKKGWIGAMDTGAFTTMAAFGGKLSDQDITSVVTYIRVTFAKGKGPS